MPFLKAAAILTIRKFSSRSEVADGSDVVAFRVGYVVGVWDAAIRLEADKTGLVASEQSIQEVAFIGAVVTGWFVFGFTPDSDVDAKSFGELFAQVRETPAWAKGCQTGFEDVGRAHDPAHIAFAPRVALMESGS